MKILSGKMNFRLSQKMDSLNNVMQTNINREIISFIYDKVIPEIQSVLKQAGTGPSRRHIQGSKISKRLPSVKYSFTVVENRKFLKKLHTKKMDRVAR